MSAHGEDRVGPVLDVSGQVGEAVLAAICALNSGVEVLDRGAYRRVLVAGRCMLSRSAVEEHLGRPFRLPGDLEQVMPSFQGTFTVDEDGASWGSQPLSPASGSIPQ